MNVLYWIKALFTNNSIGGTRANSSYDKGMRPICKEAKVSVDEKKRSDIIISPQLNSNDGEENKEKNLESKGDNRVQNANYDETITSAENALQNHQITSGCFIETEEATESEVRKKKQSDIDSCGELVLDKTLCQAEKTATKEFSFVSGVEEDSLNITVENGEKTKSVYGYDALSVLKLKSESELYEDQNNPPRIQDDELLTYLLDNSSLEFRGKTDRISYFGFSMRGLY
ncbi:MAG: hypothetical protein K6E28_09835 [Eubacterium sp.]|nr:hypothetical protein [Eubacterium sp.]